MAAAMPVKGGWCFVQVSLPRFFIRRHSLGADGPRNSGLGALTIADPAKGSRLAVKLRKSEARLQVNA